MDNVPIHLGPYKVGKTLGIGAFGKVKLGEHLVTGQRVAVKILNKGKIKHMEMSEKVRREINILNMCTHPHVIRLYEVIDTPTDIFVVTEYASGGELFDYIVSKGRLPPDEARQIFHQLISCMEYCHYHKIVHRDLKPENLLLDHDNNIKLADFGLSNVIHDGDFLRTSCGSPNYAAPEVISGNLYAGPEVDVWSCGVILYALLCGTLPFDDESIPNLFKKIKSGMYTLPPHLPPPAKELIMRMLVVDPIKRLTIADVRAHPWFQQKLPTYMNMLPHEIDMQRQFIDDEIVSMVCQLNIPGVTPELVVTAVQEHNSLNITVGGTGSGTSVSRANLAAAANETAAPPAAPAPAPTAASAIVMINNNNTNVVPGSVATPAGPPAIAGAATGTAPGAGADGIPTFSTASLARFKHDVRVAYELLLDAKRHKQRLADVMNVLQEINASRSPGSSFASSPKIGSYMGAVSPTSQITIKLDMVMREGSAGSVDSRSRQNSGTGGGVNHLLGNINTAIGAAAAANSASGQHHFGSAAVPSASTAASGAGGISGSLAAAAAASTSTASNTTASSGSASGSTGTSAVTDPNAAKRRRWYLGIQSKKDPGHVMTEVYKALLALGCRWHAMNNYRVLCAWRHAPEPPKRTTLNVNLSPFMQPHALAHSIVHTNSYKHRQMVASMAAANLNASANAGSGAAGAGSGSGGGVGAEGSQQSRNGASHSSNGGSTTRRSLTGKRHHRSRRSGNDDGDDSDGGADTPASDSDSDSNGDGKDADDSRMIDDDGIFEMQADDDVMAQTPPPPSGGGSGPGGRRIVSISQNHHGGAGRNNNMNNSSSMGTSGLGGEFAAMDMEGGGGGGSGGGLMGFRPPGAPGGGYGGGGMNNISVLQPTHGGLGNLGGVNATPVSGKGLLNGPNNLPQSQPHTQVSVPIPAAVLADPSAFEEMVCNRQHEKRLLHWLRTIPQDARVGGGNRGPALGAPVPGSIHTPSADGEYFVSHANPSPQLIKAALSLFKVQQNIYLLDFQRVEGDAFGFMKLCALIVAELKNLSSSSRSSGSSGHSSSSSSSGHHTQQQQHGSGGHSMPPQPPTTRSSSGTATTMQSSSKR